jgi:energy-coupling factor transport system permease protein
VLTALINPLFVHRGVTVLFYISGHAVTLEAALYGAAAGAMLTSVVMWCGCYHAVITSDKFIYLFGRAAPALSLSLSVCLRFIPTLRARYSEIALGQRSLGRGPEGRGLAGRVRFFARVTSVLVSWSMENAMDTAASMRARGYGLKGRTSFGLFVFTRRDGAMLALVSALAAVVVWGCAAGENSINWYPFIALPPVTARTFAVCGAYLALLLIPAAADIAGELKWKYSLSRI